jgi:hypothetical protein
MMNALIRRIAPTTLALTMMLLPGVRAAEAAGTEQKFHSIKLYVNLYNGSGTTPQEVKDAVKRANEILKPAMVRIELLDACIKENVPLPGGDDGAFTAEERRTARKDGSNEIAGADGKGKGLKASFVSSPDQADANKNALSVQCDPTLIMREHATGTERTAQTMAHEFGHIFGLEDLYDAGTENRLMHGYSSRRTDSTLTDAEKTTIKAKAKSLGTEVTMKIAGAGAFRTTEEFGAKSNPAPPTPGGSEKKVSLARMSLHQGETNYIVSLQLDGAMPLVVQQRRFHVLFDSDNNSGTGPTVFGRPGINDQLTVLSTGANNLSYIYQDRITNMTAPLAGSLTRGLETFNDETLMPPEQPSLSLVSDVIQIILPTTRLILTNGQQFTGTVVAENSVDGVTDQFDFIFNRNFSNTGPQIVTEFADYAAGQSMNFAIFGYSPLQLIELRLDDMVIESVFTSPFGDFSGEIELPISPPGFFFLTGAQVGQRSNGPVPADEFATTVINVLPPPPCVGDANGDTMVTFADITSILAHFGANYAPGTGPGDSNFDGVVNFSDVTTTLANFGLPCP